MQVQVVKKNDSCGIKEALHQMQYVYASTVVGASIPRSSTVTFVDQPDDQWSRGEAAWACSVEDESGRGYEPQENRG